MSLKGKILQRYFNSRMGRIEWMARHPLDAQHDALTAILQFGEQTDFGRRYEVDMIETVADFQRRIPLSDYNSMGDYLQQMLNGETDVTARGVVEMFARSASVDPEHVGFIPITRKGLRDGFMRGVCDVGTLYVDAHPDSRILEGKILTLCGSFGRIGKVPAGDLSALLTIYTHCADGWLRLPKSKSALLPDPDEKVEQICRECRNENITSLAGIPSWSPELMRRVLEYFGKSDLREVWSGLELLVYGVENHTPHSKAFAKLLSGKDIHRMEVFVASEGFFAIADDPQREDMLLMLDYGIFYEFRSGDAVVPLEGVAKGIIYTMIITSTNGLWRYHTDYNVVFTSLDPYRVQIASRSKNAPEQE